MGAARAVSDGRACNAAELSRTTGMAWERFGYTSWRVVRVAQGGLAWNVRPFAGGVGVNVG